MSSQFDRYHSSYSSEVQKSIAFLGKRHDFFTLAKIRHLCSIARENFPRQNPKILDVGCGVGLTDHYLAEQGIFSEIHGVDVSPEAVKKAAELNPQITYRSYDGQTLPYPDKTFDMTFAICVLHHVEPSHWQTFLNEMKRVTRSGGLVLIFEHNPWNPLTLHAVNRCEFDQDAVLLSQPKLQRLFSSCSLRPDASRYFLFFPFKSRFFERVEMFLRWLPLGAQYYVWARCSDPVKLVKDPLATATIERGQLALNAGCDDYRSFRRMLTPRYDQVWFSLLSGHVALFAELALASRVALSSGWTTVPLIALFSALMGFTIAYINLFFHEAAHLNLFPKRKWNDRLANSVIGVFTGEEIAAYRMVHFDHHRHLGTPQDTERNYFSPLNFKFLVEALFAIKLARTFLARARFIEKKQAATQSKAVRTQKILGALLHGAVVGVSLFYGNWGAAIAWVGAMVVFFPFFVTIRQVLEHRSETAQDDQDFLSESHGAMTRNFGQGPLARVLGGAGFNWHMVHHLDPQVSYTRLKELEKYLSKTKIGPELVRSKSTYTQAFFKLFSWKF